MPEILPELIASGQLPLYDFNDAIIAGIQPANPSLDTLWLDSSVTPNMMKKWGGLEWEPVGELDPTYSETVRAIETTLNNMADDNLLDYNDRKKLKDDISGVIGTVPTDVQTTLPTGTTLEAGTLGSYRSVRKAGVAAGVPSADAVYVALANAYDNLRILLNGMTPKPWDVSLANKETATPITDKALFRSTWLSYYNAEVALSERTTGFLATVLETFQTDALTALNNKRDIRLGMKLGYSDYNTTNANCIYFCGLTTNAVSFAEELSDTDGSIYDRNTKASIAVPKHSLNLTGLPAGTKGYLALNNVDATKQVWFIHLATTYVGGVMTGSQWTKRAIGIAGDNSAMVLDEDVYILGELEI